VRPGAEFEAEWIFAGPTAPSAHTSYRIFPKLGVTSRAALRGALGAQADERER
jgi:hypothetical protein